MLTHRNRIFPEMKRWRCSGMYLSYCGIRVRDLERSLKFYTELFGLKEVARGDHRKYNAGLFVLLRDATSGQKLELNWYPEDSIYAIPFTPGEGLDHIAFVVDDLKAAYKEFLEKGVEPTEISPSSFGGWVAYVKDPDGNWIEIYQRGPKKSTVGRVPEGY
jgi:lactoylglutathione lyase